jgi:hypothetical protein
MRLLRRREAIKGFSGSVRGRAARAFGITVVASLLSGLWSSAATSAQPGVTDSTQPAPATTQPQSARSQEAWRAAISPAPATKAGCFESHYPSTEWQEVPCAPAPLSPHPLADGHRPDDVGNGSDWSAAGPSGSYLSSATGWFVSVAGVTSEQDSLSGENVFSLQLNTNTFSTQLYDCTTNANSECYGWQQFVFTSANCAPNPACIYIEYVLGKYLQEHTQCPSGWNPYGPSCYMMSLITPVPAQDYADLTEYKLTGSASLDFDTVTLIVGQDGYRQVSIDIFGLMSVWQTAEFNVFGAGDGSQAQFNLGSTIVVATSVRNTAGSPIEPAPVCNQFESKTGETNNLNLVPNGCCSFGGTSPRIEFTESNAAGATSPCACPAGATWNVIASTCLFPCPDGASLNSTTSTCDFPPVQVSSTCSSEYFPPGYPVPPGVAVSVQRVWSPPGAFNATMETFSIPCCSTSIAYGLAAFQSVNGLNGPWVPLPNFVEDAGYPPPSKSGGVWLLAPPPAVGSALLLKACGSSVGGGPPATVNCMPSTVTVANCVPAPVPPYPGYNECLASGGIIGPDGKCIHIPPNCGGKLPNCQ